MHVPVLFFSLLERKILTSIFKLSNSSTESHGNDEIISRSTSYELSEENKCLLAVTIIISGNYHSHDLQFLFVAQRQVECVLGLSASL
jgi:hypothetical protein